MVKNLLIARKTCGIGKVGACLLFKKKKISFEFYIFLNDRFPLTLVKI